MEMSLQSSQSLNERDDLIVRERKLLIKVEDLREKMRQQENNFNSEKQELVSESRLYSISCVYRAALLGRAVSAARAVIFNRNVDAFKPQCSTAWQ